MKCVFFVAGHGAGPASYVDTCKKSFLVNIFQRVWRFSKYCPCLLAVAW